MLFSLFFLLEIWGKVLRKKIIELSFCTLHPGDVINSNVVERVEKLLPHKSATAIAWSLGLYFVLKSDRFDVWQLNQLNSILFDQANSDLLLTLWWIQCAVEVSRLSHSTSNCISLLSIPAFPFRGVLTYIRHIYVCAAPSGRVLAPFWSENGYTFCPFRSGIGLGFWGIYENGMNTFIVSIPNE